MSDRTVSIADLMDSSGVAFGTSGARGLVTAMRDEVCYAYTAGFLQYLHTQGSWQRGNAVAIAGDLRPSTRRIMAACAAACADLGAPVVFCGESPSPAVAMAGFAAGIPSLMVTGSHIPDDRNGIKYNRPDGEMLKSDEPGIRAQQVRLPEGRFDASGSLAQLQVLGEVDEAAERAYVARYVDFFGHQALRGMRVGVYQHSSVARDLMMEVMTGLGAEAVALARSEVFVPVDTEAIRPEDVAAAHAWAAASHYDAIVSTDGDADRPLLADEQGVWLRGDILGVLCARFLACENVVTPVSSNTAVEKSAWFNSVRRTQIGSPYVVAAMQAALAKSEAGVCGYEANGGFLLASDIARKGKVLRALPTRDAMIVLVSLLAMAAESAKKISDLVVDLPARFTASDRVKDFPTALSRNKIAALLGKDEAHAKAAIEAVFGGVCGTVTGIDQTDGVRISFANDEIIHLRPSGNAPELRCYSEAHSPARALAINQASQAILATWLHA